MLGPTSLLATFARTRLVPATGAGPTAVTVNPVAALAIARLVLLVSLRTSARVREAVAN